MNGALLYQISQWPIFVTLDKSPWHISFPYSLTESVCVCVYYTFPIVLECLCMWVTYTHRLYVHSTLGHLISELWLKVKHVPQSGVVGKVLDSGPLIRPWQPGFRAPPRPTVCALPVCASSSNIYPPISFPTVLSNEINKILLMIYIYFLSKG